MSDLWPLFLSYVLPILASALVSVVTWGLTRLTQKYGIELDLTRDSAMRYSIRKIATGAEEIAAKRLGVDPKMSGKDKLDYVLAIATKQWPKMLPEDLSRILHEELAGMSGVGATGDRVVE